MLHSLVEVSIIPHRAYLSVHDQHLPSFPLYCVITGLPRVFTVLEVARVLGWPLLVRLGGAAAHQALGAAGQDVPVEVWPGGGREHVHVV